MVRLGTQDVLREQEASPARPNPSKADHSGRVREDQATEGGRRAQQARKVEGDSKVEGRREVEDRARVGGNSNRQVR